MWLLIKDAAAKYKAIDALMTAMGSKEIDLPNIKVVATARPRSSGPGFLTRQTGKWQSQTS